MEFDVFMFNLKMADHSDHCLMHRIAEAKTTIDESQRIVDLLEKKLQQSLLPESERNGIMKELTEIKRELCKKERSLESFHQWSRKSHLLVFFVVFVIFMTYLFS